MIRSLCTRMIHGEEELQDVDHHPHGFACTTRRGERRKSTLTSQLTVVVVVLERCSSLWFCFLLLCRGVLRRCLATCHITPPVLGGGVMHVIPCANRYACGKRQQQQRDAEISHRRQEGNWIGNDTQKVIIIIARVH